MHGRVKMRLQHLRRREDSRLLVVELVYIQ